MSAPHSFHSWDCWDPAGQNSELWAAEGGQEGGRIVEDVQYTLFTGFAICIALRGIPSTVSSSVCRFTCLVLPSAKKIAGARYTYMAHCNTL